MHSMRWWCVASLAVVSACGSKMEPELYLTANPKTLTSGATATVKLSATAADGTPGTGTVRVTSTAGSLKDGADVDLSDGAGTIDFVCDTTLDADCTGTVTVSGEWVVDAVHVTGEVKLSIKAPVVIVDAGMEDAGTDAGTMVGDAGVTLTASATKTTLVANTGDTAVLTATLADVNGPIADEPVTFTTTAGSFGAGMTSTTATTDANGQAHATLQPGGPGTAAVSVRAHGLNAPLSFTFVDVASVSFESQTQQKLLASIPGSPASGARSSNLTFVVRNAANMGVSGVPLVFAVQPGSAGGATVAPTATTDATGKAIVTVTSGDSAGNITIKATVAATLGTSSEIFAVSPGTTVNYGIPSGKTSIFSCTQRNLGALHVTNVAPPTRQNVDTQCTVTLRDRKGVPVGAGITVTFYQESGAFEPNPAVTNAAGVATVTYHSYSQTLPADVTPIAGEPSSGAKNPRDMLVTLMAVVPGEEGFEDRPPADGGTDVRFDEGEWFYDQGEPFVDVNDNNQFDQAVEPDFFDTVPQNGQWDGPNGQWDQSIQLQLTTHVLLTGMASRLELSPAGPWTVGSAPLVVDFTWGDDYFNPLSNNGAGMGTSLVGTMKGSVQTTATDWPTDNLGMAISYTKVEIQGTGSSTTVTGPCVTSGAGAAPAGVRCQNAVSIGSSFSRGSPGYITFLNGNGAQSSGLVKFQANHAFSAAAYDQTNSVTFLQLP